MPVPILIMALVILTLVMVVWSLSEETWKPLLWLIPVPVCILWMIASYNMAVEEDHVMIYTIKNIPSPSGNVVQYAFFEGESPINVNKQFEAIVTNPESTFVLRHVHKNMGLGIMWFIGDDYTLKTDAERTP